MNAVKAVETVIVGAGVAGLGCARRLLQDGRDFVVVSPNIGGRILQSADGAVPLGAFYVRADYEHLNQFVMRGRRIRSRDTLRHDHLGVYTRWDRRLLAHPAQVARFLTLLYAFRGHYNQFKTNSEHVSQAEAIRADPVLEHLYHQPAAVTIHDRGFAHIARHYLAPGLHGSAFLPLNQLSGFTLLLGALPTIVATYEFTMRWDALLHGLHKALITDTVTAIQAVEAGYWIVARSGQQWLARNVVVATDTPEAQRLIGVKEVKRPVRAHMFEIDGDLRPPFATAAQHLFSDDQPTLGIVHRPNQPVLFCTQIPDPDLDRYFTRWEVIEHHDWNPAFNIGGDVLLKCEQAPNLYLIGAHNVCGLEDAYISGLYAANQIASNSIGPDSAASGLRPIATSSLGYAPGLSQAATEPV